MKRNSTEHMVKSLLAPLYAAALAVAIGVAALAAPTPSSAGREAPTGSAPTVDSVLDRVLARNPGLRSYQAHAVLDIRQVNFPWLHPVLDGHVYYSSPGFSLYDFPHTPSYLKGITKVEGTIGAPTRWRHCFDITLEDQPDAYLLHMVPKIRGEVAEMKVSIDKKTANPVYFNWTYRREGDSISMWQTYSNVGGFDVVTGQRAEIDKRPVRAKGTGSFDSFTYNVPVPTPTPTPSDPLHQCDN